MEGEIGRPFFALEFCRTCKISLDLPSYANDRCDLCGNRPVSAWVVRRYRYGKLEECTSDEIEKAKAEQE